jgi:aryl-alcohol dehydrogenase-like predicted oxidoreductase
VSSERPLGTTGLTTPPLILGGNVFGWTVDSASAPSILDAFVAGGGRMIDTADVYPAWVPGNSGGESESIVGDWLAARGIRDDVVVATKVGAPVFGSRGLGGDRIVRAAEGSLRRLRTDHIDVYFAHFDDPDTPLEETLRAFDRLVKDGKVRAIGASNYGADRLAEALDISDRNGLTAYSVLQPKFNLLEREQFEGALQDLCVKRHIAAVPYYGLAAGFLTGKYRSEADLQGRARSGSARKYLNPAGLGVLAALDEVAAQINATPGQVALAWVAAQPGVAAPIASATSVAQVDELLGAMRLQLSPTHLARLDRASAAAADGKST